MVFPSSLGTVIICGKVKNGFLLFGQLGIVENSEKEITMSGLVSCSQKAETEILGNCRKEDISILQYHYLGCEEGPGICALIMTLGSLFLIVVSLPLSLMFVVKVVQEYERAVIFRLGRLLTGGARGPGVFFIIPCVDIYEKIDMRSQTFEIPPQEVKHGLKSLE